MKLLNLMISTVALVATARATTIDFPDFSSVGGLTLNGNASQAGNVLRLTPAAFNQSGSAFSSSTIALDNLSSFSTRFQFRISDSGGIGDGDGVGADGLVFVVQTVSNSTGGSGGGLGYQGITPSVGIEFDTYNNGGVDDNNGNHVGIDLNGSIDSVVQSNVATRFNDGNIWTAWVDYNGSTHDLEVRVNQTGIRPGSAFLSYNIDLEDLLGTPNAFVGFSAGTGSGWGAQDIINWTFESDYAPIGSVPDSASTLALLGLGLAVMGGLARLRR